MSSEDCLNFLNDAGTTELRDEKKIVNKENLSAYPCREVEPNHRAVASSNVEVPTQLVQALGAMNPQRLQAIIGHIHRDIEAGCRLRQLARGVSKSDRVWRASRNERDIAYRRFQGVPFAAAAAATATSAGRRCRIRGRRKGRKGRSKKELRAAGAG